METAGRDCAEMGLSVQMGLADTLGAVWALVRYADEDAVPDRSGDAIDQEARATRARAQKRTPGQSAKRRHWTRGGAAGAGAAAAVGGIAGPGQAYGALGPLPVAALRLDQVMGSAPEPVSPARSPDHFAVRLTLPEPIGLMEDLLAGIDRMLPRLCARLEARGKGARVLQLEAHRCDQEMEAVTLGLARASRAPDRIRPLLEMKLEQIDAGYGIDMLRLEVL